MLTRLLGSQKNTKLKKVITRVSCSSQSALSKSVRGKVHKQQGKHSLEWNVKQNLFNSLEELPKLWIAVEVIVSKAPTSDVP